MVTKGKVFTFIIAPNGAEHFVTKLVKQGNKYDRTNVSVVGCNGDLIIWIAEGWFWCTAILNRQVMLQHYHILSRITFGGWKCSASVHNCPTDIPSKLKAHYTTVLVSLWTVVAEQYNGSSNSTYFIKCSSSSNSSKNYSNSKSSSAVITSSNDSTGDVHGIRSSNRYRRNSYCHRCCPLMLSLVCLVWVTKFWIHPEPKSQKMLCFIPLYSIASWSNLFLSTPFYSLLFHPVPCCSVLF